jgi:hypothetical protein
VSSSSSESSRATLLLFRFLMVFFADIFQLWIACVDHGAPKDRTRTCS